eukprot:1915096-Alexandrium_andersonii.AAC.1
MSEAAPRHTQLARGKLRIRPKWSGGRCHKCPQSCSMAWLQPTAQRTQPAGCMSDLRMGRE